MALDIILITIEVYYSKLDYAATILIKIQWSGTKIAVTSLKIYFKKNENVTHISGYLEMLGLHNLETLRI